jgi:hypothetical protein
VVLSRTSCSVPVGNFQNSFKDKRARFFSASAGILSFFSQKFALSYQIINCRVAVFIEMRLKQTLLKSSMRILKSPKHQTNHKKRKKKHPKNFQKIFQ